LFGSQNLISLEDGFNPLKTKFITMCHHFHAGVLEHFTKQEIMKRIYATYFLLNASTYMMRL